MRAGATENSIATVFERNVGYVPAGQTRAILKVNANDKVIYLPYTQVCQNDWNKARVLNHDFESAVLNQPYMDSLEGAGHPADATFAVHAGTLPVAVTMQSDGTMGGSLTSHVTPSTVIRIDQVHSDRSPVTTRQHYRRMRVQEDGVFELVSADGTGILPKKLIFNDDTQVILSEEAKRTVYGSDQSTNPDGMSSHLEIIGGVAPYTAYISAVSVPTGQVTDFLTSGLMSDGRFQLLLGLTDVPTQAPVPSDAATVDGKTGLGWQFAISSQRIYLKSISNGGQFSVPYASADVDLTLQVTVIDSVGSPAVGSFVLPIRQAPPVPVVLNSQPVIDTGSTYDMQMGVNGSSVLNGYIYDLPNAATLFKTDIPWWKPNVTAAPHHLTLDCFQHLEKGGPFKPLLTVTYPTWIDQNNTQFYDYVVAQRYLPEFTVAGPLGLISPPVSAPIYVGADFNLVFTAVGGTPPYTWTTNLLQVSPAGSGLGSNVTSDTKNLVVNGPRKKVNNNEVFPQQLTFTVTVTDSSTPYASSQTKEYFLVFITNSEFQVLLSPSLGSDFFFFTTPLITSTHNYLTDRTKLPWTNSSTYDYVVDFTNGVIPGGLQNIGWLPYYYKVTVLNSTNDAWASFKYSFPWGFVVGLRKNTAGGYTPEDYWQVNRAGIEKIYTTSPVLQLDSSNLIQDQNGKNVGFRVDQVSLKEGDLIGAAVTKIGGPTDQFWELGYQTPHFDLQPMLNTNPPRDDSHALGANMMGIQDVEGQSLDSSKAQAFQAALLSGAFDKGVYEVAPYIGKAYDTVEVTLERTDGAIFRNSFTMPTHEHNTARIWAAGADPYSNRSYLWLGQNSKFSVTLQKYSTDTTPTTVVNYYDVMFGVTEIDRLLNVGAFPARTSVVFPQVYQSFVNFFLTDAAGVEAVDSVYGNQVLHQDLNFVTSLRACVTTDIQDATSLLSPFDTLNANIDHPETDTEASYILKPQYSGVDYDQYTGGYVDPSGTADSLKRAITVAFNTDMNDTTINTSTFTVVRTSDQVPVPGVVTYTNRMAIFTPQNDLVAGTSYTATITTGITDTQGNGLAADYSWNFTTGGSTTAPAIVYTDPQKHVLIPGGQAGFYHPTLTDIDRGYRVTNLLDTLRLRDLLNSKGVPQDYQLHIVWMFLLIRPNIPLSHADAKNVFNYQNMADATGYSTSTLNALFLRGKAFTRVPVHIVCKHGGTTLIPLPSAIPVSGKPTFPITQ